MKEGTFNDFKRLCGRPERIVWAVAEQMTSGDHTIFAGEVKAVWVHEAPRKALCSIGHEAGYTFLIEKGGYRFGVVRDEERAGEAPADAWRQPRDP